MDLIEEFQNLEYEQPISNTEIYKLQEFYSDILYVPPDIYRAFPVKINPPKKKRPFDIYTFTIKWHPHFVIKVEVN